MKIARLLALVWFGLSGNSAQAFMAAPQYLAYPNPYQTPGYYGPQMNPCVGTPFFPAGAVNPYATGQIGSGAGTDPSGGLTYADYLAVSYSNQFNWPGAQPMGVGSYLPPVGLSAIQNSLVFKSVYPGY